MKSLTCNCVQDKRLKELFDDIPTLDELYALGSEGVKADIILVDVARDKKLSMLKQLIMALVKGLNSNPAAMIKKIAGLVRCVQLPCVIISSAYIYFLYPVSLVLMFLQK